MGDLRNKLMKDMRDKAHQRWLAKHYPPTSPPALPRCECGLTYLEAPIMWAAPTKRHQKAKFYCAACLPHEFLELLAQDVANLPDDA
jgi:hypothetical protein